MAHRSTLLSGCVPFGSLSASVLDLDPGLWKKDIAIFKSTMVIMLCYVMLWTALSFKRDREWIEAHKRDNATSLWLLRLILLETVDPSDSCHLHNFWLVSSKRNNFKFVPPLPELWEAPPKTAQPSNMSWQAGPAGHMSPKRKVHHVS